MTLERSGTNGWCSIHGVVLILIEEKLHTHVISFGEEKLHQWRYISEDISDIDVLELYTTTLLP
jgi:hypothetical protein